MDTKAAGDLEPQEKAFVQADIDPKGLIKPEMRVVGAHGQALGKTKFVERDETSGQVIGLTVSHGLRGRQSTRITAKQVRWVNDDSVVVDLTRDAFKRLPHQ